MRFFLLNIFLKSFKIPLCLRILEQFLGHQQFLVFMKISMANAGVQTSVTLISCIRLLGPLIGHTPRPLIGWACPQWPDTPTSGPSEAASARTGISTNVNNWSVIRVHCTNLATPQVSGPDAGMLSSNIPSLMTGDDTWWWSRQCVLAPVFTRRERRERDAGWLQVTLHVCAWLPAQGCLTVSTWPRVKYSPGS